MAGLVIKPRSRILRGHDWVYTSEVLKIFGEPEPGDVVSLKDGRDRMLGSAIYNPSSQIVARRFSRQRQDLDRDFFDRRLRLAMLQRERDGYLLQSKGCFRLVHSEGDGLPGVIVDCYDQVLVLQTLTWAMDQRRELIVAALAELFKPVAILERNDAPIRKAEGLEARVGCLFGEPPDRSEVFFAGAKQMIEWNPDDDAGGHKTALYLDQAANYSLVANMAADKKVLDCFSYRGAFAIACALAGARSVEAWEISARHTEAIRENAQANGVEVEARCVNVFDELRRASQAKQEYDLVILDPPSFTKSKGRLQEAWRGYKEIHVRAMQLLRPGGLLVSFSCSHHMTAALLFEVIEESLLDAKSSARVHQQLRQGLDHPVLVHMPETSYLHGYVLEMMPGR
ncbi:MAG: class I SAM-dependent rRNA methyltransferase [Verrucomicrobiales bacterium]